MARLEVSESAAADLESLIRSHSLPKNTKQRFKRAVAHLARVPRLGPELSGKWSGFRFVLGPWRWMIVVYTYFEEDNRVVIVTIQDARASG